MKRTILITLLIGLAAVSSAHATQVIARSLPEIVDDAGIVFQGRCLDRTVSKSPRGLLMETYTFEIEDCLKGNCPAPGERYRFSQLGGRREEAAELGAVYLIGGMSYKVEEDYILFLVEPRQQSTEPSSSKASLSAPLPPPLTSPIGLGQGVFRVEPGADGKSVVRNSFGNRGLFPASAAGLGSKAARAGVTPRAVQDGIPLKNFIRLVEELKE